MAVAVVCGLHNYIMVNNLLLVRFFTADFCDVGKTSANIIVILFPMRQKAIRAILDAVF